MSDTPAPRAISRDEMIAWCNVRAAEDRKLADDVDGEPLIVGTVLAGLKRRNARMLEAIASALAAQPERETGWQPEEEK